MIELLNGSIVRGFLEHPSGRLSGLGRVLISDLERGQKEPCLQSIEILVIAFQMTIPQLFRSV
jgi:hypothetical protein